MSVPSLSISRPSRHSSAVVGGFVILNLLIGLLFQESLQLVCQSEFLILAIYGVLFWGGMTYLIRRFSAKWNPWQNPRTGWVHGGLGLATSLINVLLGQALLMFCMVYLYQCSFSPSFNFVNAALTNNLAVNFLCYFALLGVIAFPQSLPTTSPAPESPLAHIQLSRQGKQYHLAAAAVKFIETGHNCITLHTTEGRFVTYQSLKLFLEHHESAPFVRVHRSFAVNRGWILSIRKNKNGDGWIELRDGSEVKLSRTYATSLKPSST